MKVKGREEELPFRFAVRLRVQMKRLEPHVGCQNDDIWKNLGFESEWLRILEMFLVQKSNFIIALGQDLWAERTAPGL